MCDNWFALLCIRDNNFQELHRKCDHKLLCSCHKCHHTLYNIVSCCQSLNQNLPHHPNYYPSIYRNQLHLNYYQNRCSHLRNYRWMNQMMIQKKSRWMNPTSYPSYYHCLNLTNYHLKRSKIQMMSYCYRNLNRKTLEFATLKDEEP